MPKVSVVIPVYGVEKYIERCARSLFEQTLVDMEFVFVDDCTPDNSFSILNRVINDYPKRISQIKIVRHEKNKGLSYARETGIRHATGEYIGHCDSDDWVEVTMYEKLYQKAISGQYDYVKCAHYISDGKINKGVVKVCFNDGIHKNLLLSHLLHCDGVNSVWDSITRRTIFLENSFSYTKYAMLEDFYLSTQIIEYCNSYGIVQEPLYYYFQNPDSICNVPSRDAFIKRGVQARDNIIWILDFIHKRYGNKFKKDEVVLKYVPRRIIIPIMFDTTNYLLWKSLFPGNTLKLLFSPYLSRTQKIQYLMVCLRLYSLYRKIK